jgi:predicted nuclease of predicted toxin-antitoxin system
LARSAAKAGVDRNAGRSAEIVRFLIDECLSLDLVGEAHQAGFEAYHLAHVGKAGWADWNVAAFASDNDMVVTNNATGFRRLYRRRQLHPGLMLILPNVDRPTEARLFAAALAQLAPVDDLVNQVMEIDLDDAQVKFRIYDLFAPPD